MMQQLAIKIEDLTVFECLHRDPVISKFFHLIDVTAQQESLSIVRKVYASFVASLYGENTQNWTDYLLEKVLESETVCTRTVSHAHEIPTLILESAMSELETLGILASLGPEDFISQDGVAQWKVHIVDFQAEYLSRLMNIAQYGYGQFAHYQFFRLKKKQEEIIVKPIKHMEAMQYKDLLEYKEEKRVVEENIIDFLEDHSYTHMLLYGPLQTQKSSYVTALMNRYGFQGLRIIFISFDFLDQLEEIVELVDEQPLKFIFLLEDINFQNKKEYNRVLKAMRQVISHSDIYTSNVMICVTCHENNFSEAQEKDLKELFGRQLYFEGLESESIYEKVDRNEKKEEEQARQTTTCHTTSVMRNESVLMKEVV